MARTPKRRGRLPSLVTARPSRGKAKLVKKDLTTPVGRAYKTRMTSNQDRVEQEQHFGMYRGKKKK